MRARLRAVAIALACLATTVASAEEGPAFQEVTGSFRELVDANRPVSGTALVGVAVTTPAQTADLSDLWIYLPSRYRGEIALSVATSDARYMATGVFAVNRSAQGWVRILYPQRASAGTLANYPVERLAVHAERRSDGVPLLVRWGASGGDTLQIQINSERSESFVIRSGRNGQAQRTTCATLPTGVSIRFDTVCSLPLASLRRDEQIRVFRRRGNTFVNPPVDVHVDLPRH